VDWHASWHDFVHEWESRGVEVKDVQGILNHLAARHLDIAKSQMAQASAAGHLSTKGLDRDDARENRPNDAWIDGTVNWVVGVDASSSRQPSMVSSEVLLPPGDPRGTAFVEPPIGGRDQQPILRSGEDFRLFYIFAFERDTADYVVRKTGGHGTPSGAQAAMSGIKPTGPNTKLHPIEHVLNEHRGGPTPYVSASTSPKGAPNITGEAVWIDVNKLKGNEVHSYDDIMKMSQEFLDRNPHLRERFQIWKAAQAAANAEREVLIKGEIEAGAISTKNAIRFRMAMRVGGQALFWGAVAMDTYAYFAAENKSREVARIAGGWTGAWAGGTIGVGVGAKAGAGVMVALGLAGPQAAVPEEVVTVPVGAGVGSIIGGLVGTIGGYWAGSQAGKNYYDFVQHGLDAFKP
jgi:hypothetical protein